MKMKKVILALPLIFLLPIFLCVSNEESQNVTNLTGSVSLTAYLDKSEARVGDTVMVNINLNNGLQDAIKNVKVGLVFVSNDLDVPQSEYSIESIESTHDFPLQLPIVIGERAQKGSTYSSQKVRACFDYSTTAYHDLGIGKEEVTKEFFSGDGPIKIYFDYLEDNWDTKYAKQKSFSFEIKNEGIGRVTTSNDINVLNDKIKEIEIEIPSENKFSVEGIPKGSIACSNAQGTWKCTIKNADLSLGNARYTMLLKTNSEIYGVYRIKVKVTYRYCIDSSNLPFTVMKE